jgi:Pyruvate/2-oxoacid:ferredoxin oxidoreductase delta subunit
MEQYSAEAFHKTLSALKTPSVRTVPINRELVSKWPIAPYEDAIRAIEAQTNIVVIPCICRTGGRLKETGCDKPVGNCMTFGSHANYFVENGIGRRVTIEEAKAIIKQSEEAGLVLQPTNSKISGGMCSCCGDCCGILKSLKLQPKPAETAHSNYYAVVDAEACSACETCLDRCQMDAIQIVDDKAVIDLDRCIGCGLCVSTCPEQALSLIKKPEDQLYEPPETFMDVFVQHAIERGKMR